MEFTISGFLGAVPKKGKIPVKKSFLSVFTVRKFNMGFFFEGGRGECD